MQHSSDSDSTEPDISNVVLQEQLANWAVEFKISTVATGALLSILSPFHSFLPLDPRTLKRTPTAVQTRNLQCGGEYFHIGLEYGILRLLKGESFICGEALQLQFNIDGLPLFKSSSVSLWPILCIVKQFQTQGPFVVGLYSGRKKPGDVNEFLRDFVTEGVALQANGISVDNRHFVIEIQFCL